MGRQYGLVLMVLGPQQSPADPANPLQWPRERGNLRNGKRRQLMDQAQRAVIALLLCFAIWCGWQSKLSSQPTQLLESGETTKKTNKNSANNNPFELFWNWTTRDAVSFYTFVLAIFT